MPIDKAPLDVPTNVRGFTYIQCTEPEAPQIGDSWYNPELGCNCFWNGIVWIQLASNAIIVSPCPI